MARLSGLPSEHHHEGPGDAPRRKRGRPSKAPSHPDEMPSTGKRTASPTAELSQTKRTKRGLADDDEDQIADEMEQSFSRSQQGETVHVHAQSTTTTTTRRNTRRQSEPPVVRDADEELSYPALPSTQPIAGLTPHLDRLGASRTRFTTTRRARMSMPAQLHIERVDEVDEDGGSQIQYAPLTAVLDNRTRRRLRRSHLSQEVIDIEDHQKQDKKKLLDLRRQLKARDEQIKDLEYRLEARRLGDIDITDEHTEELEQELEQARNEIDELRASSLYNGDDTGIADFSDDGDDNELLLINPDELHMSQDLDLDYVPDSKYASRVRELSSQITLESFPRISQLSHDTLIEDDVVVTPTIQDQAKARYDRELQHYTKRLGEAQGALRILTIELQNLHFLEKGAEAKDILESMRHGFDVLRAEIEKFFPGTTGGLTGQELLDKVPELFGSILMELKENITIATRSQKTEILLRRQYEGVLDLLGEADERQKQLENDVYSLDKANEEKQRTLLDLEEQKTLLTSLTIEQAAKAEAYITQIAVLQDDNQDKDVSIERFRAALKQYEQDVISLTTTITELEVSHKDQIKNLELEHAQAITILEEERATEQDGREAAEADAQQKSEYIDELEERIASMEGEVETITAQVASLGDLLKEQTLTRAAAETDRDENAQLAYERANTIENLNETIEELNEQIAKFRTTLDNERAQREKTEATLEIAEDKIEELEERLHNANMQAQELRNKLFEVQQDREAAIAQLNQDAEEREDELKQQCEMEIQLRLAAEASNEELTRNIVGLQASLVGVENDLITMTESRNELKQDRDVQVTNLAVQLSELKNKYTALENSTSSTITSLQAQITDLNNQVQRQQVEIKRLNEQIVEQERAYDEDTAVLKDEVASLKNSLAAAAEDNEAYRKENASLTDRVTNEANEMLKIQDSHQDQVEALNQAIATHTATIKNLQATNAQRQVEYEENLAELSSQITELQLMGDARAETIMILELSIEEIKKRAAAAEEDNRVTIDSMLLAQRQLQDQNEQLAAALKKRNADALAAIQEMKLKRVEVKTTGADLNRVVTGKVVKTSEKLKIGKKGGKKKVTRRQWDSGFGVDENEDGEGLNGEEPLAA
ncbi:hypothetical protein ACN47E_009406 [Coniothyrium glycines]